MKRLSIVPEVLRRVAADRITYDAAALTYYALLALVPMLVVAVALLALLSQQDTVDQITGYLSDKGVSGPVTETIHAGLDLAVQRQGTAVGALIISIAISLYSASRLMLGARTALNRIENREPKINFLKSVLIEVLSTAALIVLLVCAYTLVLVGDDLARDIFREIGLEDDMVAVWNVVRWLAALAVAGMAICLIYILAPRESFAELREDKFHIFRVLPGAGVAILVWILASIGFNFYVSYFASYNETYGFMAGTVLLLIWLWLSNLALLLGAEVNFVLADRKRTRLDAASEPIPEGD